MPITCPLVNWSLLPTAWRPVASLSVSVVTMANILIVVHNSVDHSLFHLGYQDIGEKRKVEWEKAPSGTSPHHFASDFTTLVGISSFFEVGESPEITKNHSFSLLMACIHYTSFNRRKAFKLPAYKYLKIDLPIVPIIYSLFSTPMDRLKFKLPEVVPCKYCSKLSRQ